MTKIHYLLAIIALAVVGDAFRALKKQTGCEAWGTCAIWTTVYQIMLMIVQILNT